MARIAGLRRADPVRLASATARGPRERLERNPSGCSGTSSFSGEPSGSWARDACGEDGVPWR